MIKDRAREDSSPAINRSSGDDRPLIVHAIQSPHSSMEKNVRQTIVQFTTYLLSGGGAAALTVGIYSLLVWLGGWYIGAAIISEIVGFISAFLLHKYLVFQKKERIFPHMARYVIVQIFNAVFQIAIIYMLVEYAGMDKYIPRILSIGICVPMNFFLYKYFVYV